LRPRDIQPYVSRKLEFGVKGLVGAAIGTDANREAQPFRISGSCGPLRSLGLRPYSAPSDDHEVLKAQGTSTCPPRGCEAVTLSRHPSRRRDGDARQARRIRRDLTALQPVEQALGIVEVDLGRYGSDTRQRLRRSPGRAALEGRRSGESAESRTGLDSLGAGTGDGQQGYWRRRAQQRRPKRQWRRSGVIETIPGRYRTSAADGDPTGAEIEDMLAEHRKDAVASEEMYTGWRTPPQCLSRGAGQRSGDSARLRATGDKPCAPYTPKQAMPPFCGSGSAPRSR